MVVAPCVAGSIARRVEEKCLSRSKRGRVSRVLPRRGPFCVRRPEPHPPIPTEKRNNQGLIELAVRRTGKRLHPRHTETNTPTMIDTTNRKTALGIARGGHDISENIRRDPSSARFD